MLRIIEDDRPIRSIWTGTDWYYATEGEDITKIEPYEESGEMAPVLWFAIYRGDFLWARIRSNPETQVYYFPWEGAYSCNPNLWLCLMQFEIQLDR